MSRTLDIVCIDCNVALRVAQSSRTAEVVYAGHPEIMTALGEFLFKHENHHLTIMDDEYLPKNCETIKPKKEGEDEPK